VSAFRVLVADPPWRYSDPIGKRGASANYRTMSTEEICRFPLPPLHDDCVLFLWRVAVLQSAALDVVRMWGFTLKTEICWLKKTASGQRWFGLGRITRAEHEVCLVATRGRPQVLNHSIRSTFTTDCEGLSAQVGRHSQKPDIFYTIVESLFSGPRAELFARKHRPGWECFGDELT
jgi:N6-adenosine-specific RNA methylase IME4